MSALLRDALHFAVRLGLLVAAASAGAQTMYRCGSVYQDRPCANAQDSRVIGRGQPAEPGAAAPAVDAECAARGEVAQRIMWRREAGMTAAEQRSVHREHVLILDDVYRRRGTSVEVRRAVEADCVAEKTRSAEAALIEAMAKLRATAPQPGASAPPVRKP